MQRRKFFKLSSTGADALTFGVCCKSEGSEKMPGASQVMADFKEPDYRQKIKTDFTSFKPKQSSYNVKLALMAAGSSGAKQILAASNSGENKLIKYVCDVDEEIGGRLKYRPGFEIPVEV